MRHRTSHIEIPGYTRQENNNTRSYAFETLRILAGISSKEDCVNVQSAGVWIIIVWRGRAMLVDLSGCLLPPAMLAKNVLQKFREATL